MDELITKKVVLDLIEHGRLRCALGFGKYPWGVRHCVGELAKLFVGADRADIDAAIARFDARLDE